MAKRIKVPPFPQLPDEPPPDVVFASPWEITAAEGTDPEHWDYMVDLTFRRGIRLDPAALRRELELSVAARVGLFAEWRTSLSTYASGRGPEVAFELGSDEPRELTVELPVRGTEAGGTIRLLTQMVLLDEPMPRSGGPLLPGSILWDSGSESRILESPGARLPVSVVDFSQFPEQFPSPEAVWAVKLLPEALEKAPSVGMRVYLNSGHEELVGELSRSDSSPTASVARRMFLLDVGRQLIQRALRDDTFVDPHHDFREGTLGAALRRRVRIVFAPATLSEVKSLAEDDPAEFEIRLQGALLGR